LALFTHPAVSTGDGARALCNSVHLSLETEDNVKARFELPEVRAFAQRLLTLCPILPWVAGLSTPFYREIIYAVLTELHVTYQDRKPGKYAVTFRIEDMEEIIRSQEKEIVRIGKQAGISSEFYEQRASDLARYLRDGVDLESSH
jgi:hypothetical protein